MVQSSSVLLVGDNSGVNTVTCIQVTGRKKYMAYLGDELIVSIRTIVTNRKIKFRYGEICSALLIRKKGWISRLNGVKLSFKKNAVILINPKTKTLLSSRIRGPVTSELRKKKYLRIICLANTII